MCAYSTDRRTRLLPRRARTTEPAQPRMRGFVQVWSSLDEGGLKAAVGAPHADVFGVGRYT